MTPDRRLKVAKLVSDVLGPVPMGVLLAVTVGVHGGRGVSAGAGWGLLSIVCAAVLPAVATAPLRKRRPRTRAIRLGYMSLAIVGAAIGLVVIWLLPAPSDIRVLAAGFAAGLLCSAAVNIVIESSNHVAALAGGVILAASLLTPWLIFSIGAVALLAWSRITLHAHSRNEVMIGSIVGIGSAAVVVGTLL